MSMRISDLIEALEKIQGQHGDVRVMATTLDKHVDYAPLKCVTAEVGVDPETGASMCDTLTPDERGCTHYCVLHIADD
jgi:hypothetical protein